MRKPALAITSLAATALLALTACGGNTASETQSASDSSASSSSAQSERTISVEDNFGTHELSLPVENVAVTDNRSFEILQNWGIEPVAAPKSLIPATLSEMKNNENIVDIGTHREPDLEALAAAEPKLIINGQRFSQHYEDIKELNPEATLLEFEPREGEPLDQELKRQTKALGEVFNKEKDAEKLIADFDQALERAKKAYDPDQKVMAINVSGSEIGYVAPGEGRFFGPLYDLVGMTPAMEVENTSDNHKGDDISVEAIAQSNPDVMLVLDRDAAISSGESAKPAQEVIEGSDALANVKAVKDKKVILAPSDTYTNENIITYTEMLNQMADAFEQSK